MNLRVTLVVGILAGITVSSAFAEPNFCGMKDPDPEKVCISLRLPWQEQPIYFCTDKGSFKYRNQCGSQNMHCASHYGKETLLLATPWDCCPISSIPDNCVNAQCPPPPFNRTCEAIPPPAENPWDCCPKYYCDESGSKKKECHYKQLEPGCTSPPKNKTNCVGFYDTHSCCTQFQCDGDGKPGMCPMQVQAMRYSKNGQPPMQTQGAQMMMNSSSGSMTSMSPPPPMMGTTSAGRSKRSAGMRMDSPPPPAPAGPKGSYYTTGVSSANMVPADHAVGAHSSSYGGGVNVGHSIAVEPYPGGGLHPPMPMHVHCVGDYNCPGSMKCCSSDMSVYSDGAAIPRNSHPSHGFCSDPIM